MVLDDPGLRRQLMAQFKRDAPTLADASDQQLHAECERRGLFDDWKRLDKSLSAENDSILAERDEYKRSADAWMNDAKRALDERDEWKRRAEVAESNVTRFCRDNGMELGLDPYAWLEEKIMKADAATRPCRCGAINCRADHARIAVARSPAPGIWHEDGPGIASTSVSRDDGHWIDPVDLLADDE
jgi:hypothetical protein